MNWKKKVLKSSSTILKIKLANLASWRHYIRTMNIYDLDYANEIREMLLDEMNSLEQIKLELSLN